MLIPNKTSEKHFVNNLYPFHKKPLIYQNLTSSEAAPHLDLISVF